jgi:hypothetical protein
MRARPAAQSPSAPVLERPRLELSGPKLAMAFEALVDRGEEHGGVERYVDALRLKASVFREAFAEGDSERIALATLKTLCALMPTVRRRVGPYLDPDRFPDLRARVARLLDDREDTSTTDARIGVFCRSFPEDRAHRWVRDLAGEVLHNVDPERYPLMCRWVWDAQANTGVLREIWHGEDVDRTMIDIPDRYGTYLMLREELSQFLANNGVFRDGIHYVDLLTAQVYGSYVSEQGGNYLRTDFATPEDPMQYTRRLLGLDGVDANGRTRLKVLDGQAHVVADLKLLD